MKKAIAWMTAGVLAGLLSAWAGDVKENWMAHCAKCHGADGRGDAATGKRLRAKDYTDPKVQARLKDDAMIRVTSEGKKERGRTVMKGYLGPGLLNEQEIKDLVAYIRKFKK